jgi:hypothetical protein
MKLIILLAVSWGAACIISNLKICAFLRQACQQKIPPLYSLLICPACCGFWIAFFLSMFTELHVTRDYINNTAISAIADGCIVSGFNFAVQVILVKLGAKEI